MFDIDAIASTIESLPQVLRTLLEPFDDGVLCARPAPDEWCVREVIGHLIATDTGAFSDRIAALVAGDSEIQGFDPWAAINSRDFTVGPLDALLREFATVRRASVQFLRTLSPTDLERTGEYRTLGTFAAGDFVLEWAYHDQEHLRQILAALQQHYLPDMSATMRSALLGETD